jgi:hypothetical protein
MMRRMVMLGVGLIAGCAGSTAGVRAPAPPATGQVYARATTSDTAKLRVLLNGRTPGLAHGQQAWIASDDVELGVLWAHLHRGSAPTVDFTHYIVLGTAFEGGVCQPTITGIRAERSGLLSLEYLEEGERICIMLATRIATVVAVPRRVLPGPVVYLWGFRFTVDEP